VPKGRLTLVGLCGLVNVLVTTLGSLRVAGGTERATEGGLLGGALEPARVDCAFEGDAGVDLSNLCSISIIWQGKTFLALFGFSTLASLSRTSKYRSP